MFYSRTISGSPRLLGAQVPPGRGPELAAAAGTGPPLPAWQLRDGANSGSRGGPASTGRERRRDPAKAAPAPAAPRGPPNLPACPRGRLTPCTWNPSAPPPGPSELEPSPMAAAPAALRRTRAVPALRRPRPPASPSRRPEEPSAERSAGTLGSDAGTRLDSAPWRVTGGERP